MSEKRIVKIDNDFIFKAHYALSAVEQKIILFLASRIDPLNDKRFIKQVVPIKDIEKILWSNGKKFGNPYAYLQEVVEDLLDRKIFFQKGTIVNGEKIYAGGINWFQSILVKETGQGVGIEFMFSERMQPFLLELNKYVRINAMEVMDMRGKHSIRMYQVFKAERERVRKHRHIAHLTYGVSELKAMLRIEGKYKQFDNFRRRVLEPMKDEINTHSMEIMIDYELQKTRRKVTHIEFSIQDKKEQSQKELPLQDYIPSVQELKELTWSQKNGYDELVKFGVKEGIALKQILLKVKGGDMEGYEDLFINESINHFKKWAKQQKTVKESAATFVSWWTKQDIFGTDKDVFWKIVEKVHGQKKAMEQERQDNRMIAKDMTKEEFLKWYADNKRES